MLVSELFGALNNKRVIQLHQYGQSRPGSITVEVLYCFKFKLLKTLIFSYFKFLLIEGHDSKRNSKKSRQSNSFKQNMKTPQINEESSLKNVPPSESKFGETTKILNS